VPAIAQQATPPPPAAVAVATIKVPGTSGRWDVMQVDPAAHRLYLSNTSNGSLDVFDTQTFATLAQIPGLPNSQDAQGAWSGANGLALAPELNRAFVSDQVDNSLHVYDTNSNAQTDVVSTTQKGSDSVAYDPDDKKVFVSNGDSNSITVVDATTLKVLKQINLPGAPEIAVWDTADHTLRQNLSDKNQQVIIDPKTDSVTRTIDLPVTCEPHGIGLDESTNTELIGCRQQMTTVISADGTVQMVSRHTGGSDLAGFDPVNKQFYVAAANDTSGGKQAPVLGIYGGSGTFDFIANGKTAAGAHSLAIDPADGTVYVGAGAAGTILVFPPAPTSNFLPANPAETTNVTPVLLPLPSPNATSPADIMEVDQTTNTLYVAVRTNATSTAGGIDVYDVSGSSPEFLRFIDLGTGANGVATAPDLKKIFVGLTDSTLAIVDVDQSSPTANTMIAKIVSGGAKRVDELDYDPVDKKVYAANSDDGIVTVVDAVSNQMITQFKDLGAALEQPRYNPADGMMYMTSSDQNAIFQFDPRSDTMMAKLDVGDDCNPNGLAINPNNDMAALGCSNASNPHAAIWDVKLHKVVSTIRQSGRVDGAIYSPTADRFLLASRYFRGPAITVISGDGKFVTNVGPTDANSHQVAFDAATNTIFTIMIPKGTPSLAAFALPR